MPIKDQLLLRAATLFEWRKPDLTHVLKSSFQKYLEVLSEKYVESLSYIVGAWYVIENNKEALKELESQLSDLKIDEPSFEIIQVSNPMDESKEQKLVRTYRELQANLNSVEAQDQQHKDNIEYYETMLSIFSDMSDKIGSK